MIRCLIDLLIYALAIALLVCIPVLVFGIIYILFFIIDTFTPATLLPMFKSRHEYQTFFIGTTFAFPVYLGVVGWCLHTKNKVYDAFKSFKEWCGEE